jgi:NADP-dependent 3-hydroxy acid dehydrogenase YdfG
VVLLARRVDRLTHLTKEFGQENTIAIPADVTNYDSILQARDRILYQWGQIHVLINNAGVLPPSNPIWETTPENWQRTIDTNINGVFNCIRAFLPSMLEHDYGRIISISSSMVKTLQAAAYSITKNAVDVMTEILSEEFCISWVILPEVTLPILILIWQLVIPMAVQQLLPVVFPEFSPVNQ